MKKGIQRIVALLIVATMCVAVAACKKEEPVVSKFTVPAEVTLVEGTAYQIAPTEVENIEKFTYASVDEAIASVSDTGLVTAVAPGKAEIIVEGKGVTHNVKVIVKRNEVNGLHVKKLDAIAAYPIAKSEIGNDDEGFNFGWAANFGEEHLNTKVDFTDTAADSALVVRASHSADTYSSVENGSYVAVMIAGNNAGLTEANTPEGVHTSYYAKMEVSARANHFRLWGWSNQDDIVSGKGSFRITAYVKNGANYNAVSLNARDKGTLQQSSDGWITFDGAPGTQISGAPGDNMFIYDTKTDNYDIKGKTVIIAVEFRAVANTMGIDGTNLQSRFGIKRMGFVLDAAPNFTITSPTTVTLPISGTAQITATVEGEMSADGFTYKSDAESVATVSDIGLITALTTGEANITVKNQTIEKQVKVTVANAGFDLPAAQKLVAGDANSDSFKIEPTNVTNVDTFTYESNAPFIASVDNEGSVTAHSAGICEIKVKGGTLNKAVTINVAAVSILGVDNNKLKNITSLTKEEITISDIQLFNFGCGIDLTTDSTQFSADDSAANNVKALRGVAANGFTVLQNDGKWINMITNLSPTIPTAYPHAAIYSKVTVPDLANFRVWAYSSAPDATVSGKGQFRVVFYLPNEDYTRFTAFNPEFSFQESGMPAEKLGGGYAKFSGGIDCFFAYSVPTEIKGKEVIMSIETMGLTDVEDKQTRIGIKRVGFTG